eukprot:1160222-Pelagomonas_calceolata.AAC.17
MQSSFRKARQEAAVLCLPGAPKVWPMLQVEERLTAVLGRLGGVLAEYEREVEHEGKHFCCCSF